jgi:hypothetical protein
MRERSFMGCLERNFFEGPIRALQREALKFRHYEQITKNPINKQHWADRANDYEEAARTLEQLRGLKS